MHQDLGLTDVSGRASGGGCGCGGGGACACGGHAGASTDSARSVQPVQRFAVTGMTCGHCVASVTEEVGALDGVESVEVRLQPGGASAVSVRASRLLRVDEVRAAVEDAGYALQPA